MMESPASSTLEPMVSIHVLPLAKSLHMTAVSLVGELDRSNEHEARSAIERTLNRGVTCLIVDLGGLVFMDSSGVNLLLRAYHVLMQRHGRLALVAPAGPVRRLLEVVRFMSLVPVYLSLQEALSDLAPPDLQSPHEIQDTQPASVIPR